MTIAAFYFRNDYIGKFSGDRTNIIHFKTGSGQPGSQFFGAQINRLRGFLFRVWA